MLLKYFLTKLLAVIILNQTKTDLEIKIDVLGFLIRYFSNYYTLHRSDLAARAAPLDPRLSNLQLI